MALNQSRVVGWFRACLAAPAARRLIAGAHWIAADHFITAAKPWA